MACSAGYQSLQPERETLMVLAASSLTEPFEQLAEEFERRYPHVRVRLNFAGTQQLRVLLEQGLPADVVATANALHMRALGHRGLVSQPELFARNRLVLVVLRGNPAGIGGLADLTRPHRLVLAASSVPAGGYARQVLSNLEAYFGQDFSESVLKNLVSEESNVKSVLMKVVMGEADAGFVYATDVVAVSDDSLIVVPIPTPANVTADYYIARVAAEANQALARDFIDFVLSPEGREVLSSYGFE